MNQETIENFIKNLSKSDFDNVVRLILDKIFHLKAIDVDGKGDGGSDYRIFSDEYSNRTVAIQKTIQETDWQSKAVADAHKAKSVLEAKRFFFLTSRAHEAGDLRSVENSISSELLIPATCLGATEIAGLIIEEKLLEDFAYSIGLNLDIAFKHRPDQREIMLHTYFYLSDDRSNLQWEIYESALLFQLHHSDKSMTREELLEKAMSLLGLQESRRQSLSGRIDALLSYGKIIKKYNELQLAPSTMQSLQVADGIYLKELNQLAAAQVDLISEYGGDWDQLKSERASLLLAKCFVEEQIKTAKNASLSFTMSGFGGVLDSASDKLKELISSSSVSKDMINIVFQKMVELAREVPLVKKLAASVTYIALENLNPNKSSAILGCSSWRDIRVILDASVAIPYIVSSIFGPSTGRFSRGSNDTIKILKKRGAVISIPWHYLNECASHLVGALEYCRDMPEFEDDFRYSQNGYVSHYYQLKHSGVKIPNSLKEYIKEISNTAIKSYGERGDFIRRVMNDLQPLFRSYGVIFEDTPKLLEKYTKDIQVEYVYTLQKLSIKKTQNLIEHDVNVLAHIRRNCTEHYGNYMCLTWDKVMIEVGKKFQNIGWVVSPVEAADLVQSQIKIEDGKLLGLAHSIARTMERPAFLGARIIDRAIELSGEQLADWEFRKRIREYKDQALERIDLRSIDFNLDDFDRETNKFLQDLGVEIPEKNDSSVETIE